ncbi:MAG: hypothetical protein ACKPCM_02670, partial [Pseudanabaena sp.]
MMANIIQEVILDPTGLYPVESGYIAITTEVEWLKHFGVSNSPYWIIGDRLCEWTLKWLEVWGKTNLVKTKQSPRRTLESIFDPFPLPDDWTDQQLINLELKLSQFPKDNPIAFLLADLSNTNAQIWHESASPQNLAAWLTTQIPSEYQPIEKVWQHRQAEQDNTLAKYYQTTDKQTLLKQWIGIAKPNIPDLGDYPLAIPDAIASEFDQYWTQIILESNGNILESISTNQFGLERISSLAYSLLRERPTLISKSKIAKLSLNSQQYSELIAKLPPTQPNPLPISADYKTAFDWVTNDYLPFRKWETVTRKLPIDQRQSDSLASSFEEWIYKHYSSLRVTPVAESQLNYNVAAIVQSLVSEQFSVLWVVIDGLGWLDHQELLQYLTESKQLASETALSPRFSILPTKTEYAKWSLYAQLTCDDASWSVSADLNKVLKKVGAGERYTDQQRQPQLYPALTQNKYQLYCWDTVKLDKLYHSGRDWGSLYDLDRRNTLKNLAEDIKYCIELHPNPHTLKVVIASDHGQMMGEVAQIKDYPENLEADGRMAIGKTDDPRFMVLDKERFGLPHDISIVRGSFCLGSFNKNTAGESLGTHGGLFPEEVVVGVSILSTVVTRSPVFISCQGNGTASQSGEITITIDNSLNSVPLTSLCLYINEIPILKNGYSDLEAVPAHAKVS